MAEGGPIDPGPQLTQETEHDENVSGYTVNLLDLPIEIFLKICSYLEADFVPTLGDVCCQMREVLSDGSLWRCWVSKRLRYRYPAIPGLRVWQTDEGMNWQETCGDIDRETRRWRGGVRTMQHRIAKEGHYATIDSVLLFNKGEFCVSGSRDRALALWHVPTVRSCTTFYMREKVKYLNATPLALITDAHKGWVWDLAVDRVDGASMLYSGGWDNTVKTWDLEQYMVNKQTFKTEMSVLSLAAEGSVVWAGLYSRQVVMFDVRAGDTPVLKYKQHKGPVLRLQRRNNLIASLSEDKTIAIWDQTAGKPVVQEIKCTGDDGFPVCFNWSEAAMYVGDSKGSLHLIDPEEFVHKQSYKLWPEPEAGVPFDKVTGLYQGRGSVIAASDKGQIKCLYPSDPLQEFASFNTTASLITGIQYLNGVFVAATCDSSLEFWFPTETMEPEKLL